MRNLSFNARKVTLASSAQREETYKSSNDPLGNGNGMVWAAAKSEKIADPESK